MQVEAFPPVALCYSRALRRASNRILRLYDDALAPCGITTFEYAILAHLQREQTAALSSVAETFFLDRAVLRYKLGPLERSGLVALAVDAEDRRARRLVLTPAGQHKVIEAMEFWSRAQARFEAAIGAEEALALRQTADMVVSPAFINRFLAA
jgi:DNA-binding MarR family transcriptional regulator